MFCRHLSAHRPMRSEGVPIDNATTQTISLERRDYPHEPGGAEAGIRSGVFRSKPSCSRILTLSPLLKSSRFTATTIPFSSLYDRMSEERSGDWNAESRGLFRRPPKVGPPRPGLAPATSGLTVALRTKPWSGSRLVADLLPRAFTPNSSSDETVFHGNLPDGELPRAH